MKQLFTIFLCLTIGIAGVAQTVVIETKEFDPQDSTYSFVTEGLELVHTSMNGLLDSALLGKWDRGEMSDADMAKIMQIPGVLDRLTTASLFVKLSRMVIVKKGKKELDLLTCYIIFTPAKQVTTNGNMTLQVIFEDGTSRQYRNEARDRSWKKGERASIYFTLSSTDPLATHALKSARLSAGEIQLQGKASRQNKLTVPKMVTVINAEPLKF